MAEELKLQAVREVNTKFLSTLPGTFTTQFQHSVQNAISKPFFLYGTLQAPSLLSLILTGTITNAIKFKGLLHPATLAYHSRRRLYRKAQPVLFHTDALDDEVDGYLFFPTDEKWIGILEDFEGEGEAHIRTDVKVTTMTGAENSAETNEHEVEPMVYVWNGDMEEVMDEKWEFKVFEKENLEGYLDIFEQMEFTGE